MDVGYVEDWHRKILNLIGSSLYQCNTDKL